MLYKPINATPNMTNIDVSDGNFEFKADVPGKEITGSVITINDVEKNDIIGRVITDNSKNNIPPSHLICRDGNSYIQKYDYLQDFDAKNNNKNFDVFYQSDNTELFKSLSNGKEYSWNTLYWNENDKPQNKYFRKNRRVWNSLEYDVVNGSYSRYSDAKGDYVFIEKTISDISNETYQGYYLGGFVFTNYTPQNGHTLEITFDEDKSKSYIVGIDYISYFKGQYSDTTFLQNTFDYTEFKKALDELIKENGNGVKINFTLRKVTLSDITDGTICLYPFYGAIEPASNATDIWNAFKPSSGGGVTVVNDYSSIEYFYNIAYIKNIKFFYPLGYGSSTGSIKPILTWNYNKSQRGNDIDGYDKITATLLPADLYQTSPDYYFNARSKPDLKINLSNGETDASNITTLNDMSAKVSLSYSQAENITLNCAQYTLYKLDNGSRIKISESPIITSEFTSAFDHTFQGLLPNSQYTAECWVMDSDGTVAQTYLNFKTSIESVSDIKEVFKNNNQFSGTVSVDCNNYSGSASLNYNFSNLNSFRTLNYTIYKKSANNSFSEFVGRQVVIDKSKSYLSGATDYNLTNFTEYEYLIQAEGWGIGQIPSDTASQRDLYIDNLYTDDSLDKMLLKKLGSEAIAVTAGKEYYTYNNNKFAAVDLSQATTLPELSDGSIYCEKVSELSHFKCLLNTNSIRTDFCGTSVLGVSLDGDIYKVNNIFISYGSLSSDTEDFQVNLQNNYVSGFGLFEKEQKGYSGNITGQKKLLLKENIRQEDWLNFINNDDKKILKDCSGRTMIIGIDSASVQPHYFPSVGQLNEVTISYHEIGSTKDMPILSLVGGIE